MKALSAPAFALVAGLLAAAPSRADVLVNETFTGTTIHDSLTINLADANPANDNLGKWIDFPNSFRWNVVNDPAFCQGPCEGEAARHLVQTSDSTNLLFYGLDAGGIAAGTELLLSLDYIFASPSAGRTGRVYLAGMLEGVHSLDPFAPWFPPSDTDDGVVLISQALDSDTWTSASFGVTLAQSFDALVVAVEMGGTTGLRGIDNVVLQTVPEPAGLALVAVGLLGLAGMRRRRS